MKKQLPPITKPLPNGEGWEAYIIVIEEGESEGKSFGGLGNTETAALADARMKADAYAQSGG